MEASRSEKRLFLIIVLLNVLGLIVGWTIGEINKVGCQLGYHVAYSNGINLYVCAKKQEDDTRKDK